MASTTCTTGEAETKYYEELYRDYDRTKSKSDRWFTSIKCKRSSCKSLKSYSCTRGITYTHFMTYRRKCIKLREQECEDLTDKQRKKIDTGGDAEMCEKCAFVHAEANAIMHKTCIDLKGCTIYTTLFPCNECAKLIIQSGIMTVYYLDVPSTTKLWMKASCHLLSTAQYILGAIPKERPSPTDTTTEQEQGICHEQQPEVQNREKEQLSTVPKQQHSEAANPQTKEAWTQTDHEPVKLCEQYRPRKPITIRWRNDHDRESLSSKRDLQFAADGQDK